MFFFVDRFWGNLIIVGSFVGGFIVLIILGKLNFWGIWNLLMIVL